MKWCLGICLTITLCLPLRAVSRSVPKPAPVVPSILKRTVSPPPGDQWKTVDWDHLSDYIARLQRSTGPAAVSLRQRITHGPADLAREMEAARSVGIPLVLADLHLPVVPPDQNGATDLKRWGRTWESFSDQEIALTNMMEARRTLTPDEAGRLRTAFDREKPLLDEVIRSLAKPYFVVEHRGSDPIADFPFNSKAREATKFMKDNGLLLSIEGRYREAVELQAKGFRLSAAMESGPTLISYLVGAAINSMVLRGLEEILWHAGADEGANGTDIQAALRDAGPAVPLSQVLKVAVVDAVSTADQIRATDPRGLYGTHLKPGREPKALTPVERRFVLNLCDAVEADYLLAVRPLIAVADQPFPVTRQVFARMSAQYVTPADPIRRLVSEVMFTELAHSQVIWTTEAARRDVVRTAARVMAYRARVGRYPERLDEATTPPIDPFTGGPLGYRREPAGFVVYSRGESGVFDGGQPGEKPGSRQAYFRYPAPPVISLADYNKQLQQDEKEEKDRGENSAFSRVEVQTIVASSDGRVLATSVGSFMPPTTTVKVWDPKAPARARIIIARKATFTLALSPDGKVLAGADDPNLVASAGRLFPISMDGKAGAVPKGVVTLWDTATGRELRTLRPPGAVASLVFSPDKRTLAAVTGDGWVTLWDWRNGKQTIRVRAGRETTSSAAFSPDAKLLVTGGDYDGGIKFWNARTGALLGTAPAHKNAVVGIAFSPDGRHFATASWDDTAKLWDAKSRRPIWTFKGHSFNVWSTAFSPDGRLLATVSSEVKVWDVSTRKALLTKPVDADTVAFLRDGHRLAIGVGKSVQIVTVPRLGRTSRHR